MLKARTKECNILSIDWHAGSGPPYDQAIANARVVALEIKYMLNFLKVSKSIKTTKCEEFYSIGEF